MSDSEVIARFVVQAQEFNRALVGLQKVTQQMAREFQKLYRAVSRYNRSPSEFRAGHKWNARSWWSV